MTAIIEHWRRLVLPPDDAPTRWHELDDAGRWVEVPADSIILRRHLAGVSGYGIAPDWPDLRSGGRLARWGVVRLETVPEVALRLEGALAARGLAVRTVWDGRGGLALWLFTEPMALGPLEAALERIAGLALADGALEATVLAPGGPEPVLIVPGWRRDCAGWSYLVTPSFQPGPLTLEIPGEVFWDHQAQQLAGVQPSAAMAVVAFAGAAEPALGQRLGEAAGEAAGSAGLRASPGLQSGPLSAVQPLRAGPLPAGRAGPMPASAAPTYPAPPDLQERPVLRAGEPIARSADIIFDLLVANPLHAIGAPFAELTRLLDGGFVGSRLYMVQVRVGAQASILTLLTQLAEAAAREQVPAVLLTFGAGPDEILDAAFARTAEMAVEMVERAPASRPPATQARLLTAVRRYLADVGPHLTIIEGTKTTTIDALVDWIAVARARYDLPRGRPLMVVIDDLDGLVLEGTASPLDRMRALKRLAREEGVAVVVAVPEGDRRATREGAFEGQMYAVADVVMMLQLAPRRTDLLINTVEARLELVKNRGGVGRGSVGLTFEAHLQRFRAEER